MTAKVNKGLRAKKRSPKAPEIKEETETAANYLETVKPIKIAPEAFNDAFKWSPDSIKRGQEIHKADITCRTPTIRLFIEDLYSPLKASPIQSWSDIVLEFSEQN